MISQHVCIFFFDAGTTYVIVYDIFSPYKAMKGFILTLELWEES